MANAWESRFQRMMQSDPTKWRLEDLQPLSHLELSGLCDLMGIAHTGTKEKLYLRLLSAADLRGTLAGIEAPEELTTRYKLKELQALCRRAGTFPGTNKYGAAASLLNWRNGCRRRGQTALKNARANRKPLVQPALPFD